MSCCGRNPYDSLQSSWTREGDLVQNNYAPPNGWEYDPKNTWPMGVAEGYWSPSSYAKSAFAWRRVGNVTPDNSDYMNTLAISAMPAMYAEKYTSTARSTSASNFSTLKNTWIPTRPYTTN